MSSQNIKVFVAGHNGMVGKSITELLQRNSYNLILKNRVELDLLNKEQTDSFIRDSSPDVVILCAAKVGGIKANMNNQIEFLLENLTIQNNVITSSFEHGVKKFIFLSSSCIYPRHSKQPMKEEYLFNGKLEPTNEGYALAKLTGLKLIEYYNIYKKWDSITLIPCNLYGPNDSFDLQNSHVLSATVKKIVDAKDNNLKKVEMWGTGNARREFMHVRDLANSVLFFLENNLGDLKYINIGTGEDISIYELANLIKSKVGYEGEINWNPEMPDGMPIKCLEVSNMVNLGFTPKISLDFGIEEVIKVYKTTISNVY